MGNAFCSSAEEFRIKKGAVVYSKAAASTILDIQGVSGQMFTVIDNLVGLIHAVYESSGIPIFEVFSDNVLVLGKEASPALVVRESTVNQTVLATTITVVTVASLDMSLSNNVKRYLLQANLTINFGTDPAVTESCTHTFIFKQDAVAGRTVTWNTAGTAVAWNGGVTPVIAAGANELTIITVVWTGSEYLGYVTFES